MAANLRFPPAWRYLFMQQMITGCSRCWHSIHSTSMHSAGALLMPSSSPAQMQRRCAMQPLFVGVVKWKICHSVAHVLDKHCHCHHRMAAELMAIHSEPTTPTTRHCPSYRPSEYTTWKQKQPSMSVSFPTRMLSAACGGQPMRKTLCWQLQATRQRTGHTSAQQSGGPCTASRPPLPACSRAPQSPACWLWAVLMPR